MRGLEDGRFPGLVAHIRVPILVSWPHVGTVFGVEGLIELLKALVRVGMLQARMGILTHIAQSLEAIIVKGASIASIRSRSIK